MSKVNNFKNEIDKKLSHLNFEDKSKIINEIISDFEQQSSATGKTIDELIEGVKNINVFLNLYLSKYDLPYVQDAKKNSFARYVFAFIFVTPIILIIAGYFVLQSFLPIIEINDDEGTLKMFGGAISLNAATQGQDLKHDILMDFSQVNRPHILKANLDLGQVNEIYIHGDEINFRIKTNEEGKFNYRCESSDEQNNFLTKNDKKMNLNLTGVTKCDIEIPENIRWEGHFDKGLVALKNLKQNFNLHLDYGIVTWLQEDDFYNMHVNVEKGLILGDNQRLQNLNGSFLGNITIEHGKFQLW